MTRISGYLYNALGEIVQYGKLHISLQQDMVSVAGTKVVPLTVSVDLSQDGGLIDVSLYATVGAAPAGLTYFVEFDPDPDDLAQLPRTKNGYWSNYWAVPNVASVPLGNFTSAERGTPSANYMPLGGSLSAGDNVLLGESPTATMKALRANMLGKTPEIRFNPVADRWEYSNDGVTFSAIGSGGGFEGNIEGDSATFTGVVSAESFTGSGAGLQSLNASFLGTGTIPSGRFPGILPNISGQNLTNLNAAALASGVVPVDRLPSLVDAQIAAGAAIAWSKISKNGSSIADLATRNVEDLNAGVLPVARGGTGGVATPTNNGVGYGTGTGLAYTAAGNVGQILKVSATGRPEWGDPAASSGHGLLSSAHSDVVAAAVQRGSLIVGLGATPAWTRLDIGANGSFLRSNGNEPAWSTDGSGLTNLNAAALASGTLSDDRLSVNVLRGNVANVFAGLQTFNAGARLKNNFALSGRNAADTADFSLTKLDSNNQAVYGTNVIPLILKSNGVRPTALADKDVWLEITGASPDKKIALMVMDGTTVRELATIKV